jgi:hypothetical protein
MEADPCCASSSSTSKRTDVSTAVTIASGTKVFVTVGSGGQMAAASPLFEGIRLRPFPRDQKISLGLNLQGLASLQAQQLAGFPCEDEFSCWLNGGSHFTLQGSVSHTWCQIISLRPDSVSPAEVRRTRWGKERTGGMTKALIAVFGRWR